MSWFTKFIGYDDGRAIANISTIAIAAIAAMHGLGMISDPVFTAIGAVAAMLGIQANKNPK